ncbi:alpha/beta hydrolase [Dactylosporangium sp. NPDC005555]|uniref:alpha/beta fold hydrolase n=1 Tax=Dactylosporangium sp. NPDC005555 TaxID=3154889 RepID=UPI00339E1F4C
MTELRVLRGGSGTPAVLLLHGLGATADVWDDLTALLGCAWVAPDLPGHGGSAWLDGYTFAGVADAVAPLVDPHGTVVVGHSFGGVIGLHLAHLPGVRAVVGLGIKVAWTQDDLDRAAAIARKPPIIHPTRDEAATRFQRVAGLVGLKDDAPGAAVVRDGAGWRSTHDPRTFAVGEPGVAALLAAAPVPVVLARGEGDRMVSREQLAALVPEPVDLPGVGHNAHVEGPAALLPVIAALR